MRGTYYILLLLSVSLCACLSKTTAKKNASIPPTKLDSNALLTQMQPSKDDAMHYETPTLQKRLGVDPVLRSALRKILAGSPEFSPEEIRGFEKGGFNLHTLEINNQIWIAIVERGTWRGGGAFLFRAGAARPVIVQAPHSYHDMDTGEVAYRVFQETNARGLYLNTAHRYSQKSPQAKGPNPADLSHRSDTFFFSFTEAMADLGDMTFVQIHGFEEDASEKFDVVVSDTTAAPTESLKEFAYTLGELAPKLTVGVYGETTSRYGATANPVGRWLRRHKRGEFIHIELTPTLRAAWKLDATPLVETIKKIPFKTDEEDSE